MAEEQLSPRGRAVALGALVLGGAALGTAPIFVRLAQEAGVGPSATAFWRLVLAVGPLALLAAADRSGPSPAQPKTVRPWLMTALAGVFFAGDLVTWHAGIVRTTAANATLLPNMTPLVVTLAAWIAFKERPRAGFLSALAATLLGAALLSGANLAAAAPGDAASRGLGDALSALTALWYAAYMLAVKAARAAWSARRVMALSTLVSAPIALAAALGFRDALLPAHAVGWLWLAGLAALPHLVGQGGLAFALGRLPAALSALVILIQPLVAALIAWALFGEALGPVQLMGGALVVAGIVLAQRVPKPPRDGPSLGGGRTNG